MDTLPTAARIEERDRRRPGHQQHGIDAVVSENIEQQIDVLELQRAEIFHTNCSPYNSPRRSKHTGTSGASVLEAAPAFYRMP
jgi:hypothetical protein